MPQDAGRTSYTYGVERPEFVLQPDYQFSHNGYGLLQLSVNFDVDIERAGESAISFTRGSSFPGGTGPLSPALKKTTWTLVKADEVGRDGNLARVRAMYVGIAENSSTTETEAVLTSAAVSEPIESHPNFSVVQVPYIASSNSTGIPLGGKFTNGSPPIIQNAKDPNNPFRAYWVSNQGSPGVFPWQFVAFLPSTDNATPNRKAGIKSWFRPSVTLRLTAYTNNETLAADSAKLCGYILNSPTFGIFELPDAYQKIQQDERAASKFGDNKNWLCTGANMEVYGGLFKCTADLLLSGVIGWDDDIYPKDTSAI